MGGFVVADVETIGNQIEAGFWGLIGVIFAAQAIRTRGAVRVRCATAAVVLLCFGLSDLFEMRTGAWWRPWWLLAIKAACILALLTLLWRHGRAGRRPPRV